MTVCIGYHQPNYICIAADTRVTYGYPAIYIEDGKQKLIETSIGLITGSGFAPLLDGVVDRLNQENITSISQIEDITNNEVERLYKEYSENPNPSYSFDDLEEFILCTNWLYSYLTQNDDGEHLLRLALIAGPTSRDNKCENYLVNSNYAKVLLPKEFDQSQCEGYSEQLNASLNSKLTGDLGKDILMINSIFNDLILEIASISDGVSKEYFFGIHGFDKTAVLTPLETKKLLSMNL